MNDKSFVGKVYHVSGMPVYVNPGTGPVDGADEYHARQNISQMIIDCGYSLNDVRVIRHRGGDNNGRFEFCLDCNGMEAWIEMPGLEIDQVRYLGEEGQNIWDFPRLYVNGGSWVWNYAISCVKSAFGEDV